jgi:hypothetical protein
MLDGPAAKQGQLLTIEEVGEILQRMPSEMECMDRCGD